MPEGSSSGLEPTPRLVDSAILVLVAFEVGSGLLGLLVGTPDTGWLFVLHGVAGTGLVVLLFWKLRRVRHRLLDRGAWDRETPVSVVLAGIALGALVTGLAWTVLDVVRVEGFTLLVGHMLLGVLTVPILAWHLRHRLRLPTTNDVDGRRTSLQFGAVLVGGALAWRGKEVLSQVIGLAGADRRFTGSKRAGGSGNRFPVTSWVADDPGPVAVVDWRLTVAGDVETPLEVDYETLTGGDRSGEEPSDGESTDGDPTGGDSTDGDPTDGDSTDGDPSNGNPTGKRVGRERLDATLDCTSGWYAKRTWTGVPLGRLVEEAGPTEDTAWVRVRSVTGYRWSFPLDEARSMLLATHVDGDPLDHGHGAPARLIAPGRRGFQWVKWVDRIDCTTQQDLSQWVAIFVSGFD